MFAKLSTLALALPLVSALTINPLTGATTGGLVTISWTASTTDASYFSIELVNTVFHNTFAVANNVQTSLGQITIQLPQVPVGDGYTIEAIAINNINQVYSQSGDFSIGAASSASTTAPSTTLTTAASTSSGSVTTPSVTATTPVSSVSPVASTTSSSAATSTPSTFSSSGATSFKLVGMAPAAALVLSAVAGAAMVF